MKATRVPILIDIGSGDAVHPARQDLDYPRLIPGLPAARIRAYPPQSVVAEKFDAMIRFDAETTRLKDHYDIWAISETFTLDIGSLVEAVRRTLDRRGRSVPAEWPANPAPAFAERADKLAQWKVFLNRTAPVLEPPPLSDLLAHLRRFPQPILRGIQTNVTPPPIQWVPGRGWRDIP